MPHRRSSKQVCRRSTFVATSTSITVAAHARRLGRALTDLAADEDASVSVIDGADEHEHATVHRVEALVGVAGKAVDPAHRAHAAAAVADGEMAQNPRARVAVVAEVRGDCCLAEAHAGVLREARRDFAALGAGVDETLLRAFKGHCGLRSVPRGAAVQSPRSSHSPWRVHRH